MATITYVTHDGEDYPAPVTPGRSLMQIAVDEAIPGIDGDCGGEAACGTCHVVVDERSFCALAPLRTHRSSCSHACPGCSGTWSASRRRTLRRSGPKPGCVEPCSCWSGLPQ